MREIHNWINNVINSGNIDDILFNRWKEKNWNEWKEWKKKMEELKNKIHDLDVWKIWAEEHHNKWKKWAERRLNNWNHFIIDKTEYDLYYIWRDHHTGDIDDFKKWKEMHLDDWDMWKKELEDRIDKKKWEEDH